MLVHKIFFLDIEGGWNRTYLFGYFAISEVGQTRMHIVTWPCRILQKWFTCSKMRLVEILWQSLRLLNWKGWMETCTCRTRNWRHSLQHKASLIFWLCWSNTECSDSVLRSCFVLDLLSNIVSISCKFQWRNLVLLILLGQYASILFVKQEFAHWLVWDITMCYDAGITNQLSLLQLLLLGLLLYLVFSVEYLVRKYLL